MGQSTLGCILLVDDEPGIVNSLRPALKASGYEVIVATDGNEAISSMAEAEIDAVLLDLGLPDMDGKDVIEAIRQRSMAPIIVVSARHQEVEKVAALDRGADDYVDKPFVLRELLARVRAAMRRSRAQRESSGSTKTSFAVPPLFIDYATREVRLNGTPVKLSRKEFALLRLLSENVGQVVTQRRLLAAGWARSDTDPHYLRVYMGMLRQKFEAQPSEPRLILTEPGVGYRLAIPAA
jgi:two-component system KDP operon response regulator KdpE